jgi:nuclear pore complex protein Nup98-Nup96
MVFQRATKTNLLRSSVRLLLSEPRHPLKRIASSEGLTPLAPNNRAKLHRVSTSSCSLAILTFPAVFGGSTTGSSIFGNNNNALGQNQPQQNPAALSNNIFGGGNNTLFNKPAAPTGPTLFGGSQPAPAANPPVFGASQPANNTLFGAKPQQPLAASGTMGMFGGLTNSSNNLTASAAVPGAQGTLSASISNPISTDLPIFALLPPGPRAVDFDQSTKKKMGFFSDVPTRSPAPRVQLGYSPSSSTKLRGFGNTPASAGLFASSNPNALSLMKAGSDSKMSMSMSTAFGSQESLLGGSPQKPSVKKLVIDKKVEPTELFVKTGSPQKGGKIVFSSALSIAARQNTPSGVIDSPERQSPTPVPPRPKSTPGRFTAAPSIADVDSDPASFQTSGSKKLHEGDYYVQPDIETLKSAGYEQLAAYKGLIVGRVGYGEIHFLEPVDLTGLPRLGALLGDVIRFEDKECTVYPDIDDVDKPLPGTGLNVPARISLKKCFAVDKATREPLRDESHPGVIKHIKRLRNIKNTHFENFDITDGTWTFTVEHF